MSMVGVPLTVLSLTPLIRPMRFPNIAFTYLLPIVPFTAWWDGIASTIRAYSIPELEELVDGLGHDGYRFRIERTRSDKVPVHVTALIGAPT
jgi:hypothetical protein